MGDPQPELRYGSSTVLTALASFDAERETLQPWVLVGDLSLLEGLNCSEAVALARDEEAKVTPSEELEGDAQGSAGAGGAGDGEPEPVLEQPALRARAVPALPAGTLTTGRSLLMVLTGCVGGAAYTDSVESSVCGSDYSAMSPTLQPVVVKLSRASGYDKVGLQAVQASQAIGQVDVRASGDDGALAITFASGVGFGAIAPRPADVRFTEAELGLTARNHGLQAVGDGSVVFRESWMAIRSFSGIEAVEPSRTYTAVLVGPDPLLVKKGWWNESHFVLVDNDPTRE